MSWRGDLLTALLSAWLITGVLLDAWAHNTRPSLETFFTPWHAVLYSGFLAVGGWVTWTVFRFRRGAASWAAALPAGYGLAGCGVIVFAVSGQCVLMQGAGGFREPALAVLGGVGALAVEGLARGLRPEAGDRWRLVTFSGLAPPLSSGASTWRASPCATTDWAGAWSSGAGR